MKSKLIAPLLFTFLLFASGALHAVTIAERLPSEMIILRSPNHTHEKWKENSRVVVKGEGLVRYIPVDQSEGNWSESVTIQYSTSFVGGTANSVEKAMKMLQQTARQCHRGKITWKVIEQNKSDGIYELILHRPPMSEHMLGRVFLTDTRFHCISLTQITKKMSDEEREQRIKTLRESAFIVSTEAAKEEPQSLSILGTTKK